MSWLLGKVDGIDKEKLKKPPVPIRRPVSTMDYMESAFNRWIPGGHFEDHNYKFPGLKDTIKPWRKQKTNKVSAREPQPDGG